MTREEALEAIKGWDFLNEQEREAIETIIPELKRDDRKRIKENCIHFLELQKSHHASTIEIDECIDWLKGLVPPKWLYRLEYKDGTCGLWYNGEGKWCFEQGIGSLVGCKTKDLPMDHDERYKQGGRDWFSSCSRKEDLLHWYSLKDAEELIKKGFVFTRYLATEYHEYENETVFIKDSSLVREEIDIFELFGKTKPIFKEGDWLQYRSHEPFLVKEITEQGYVSGEECLPFEWENEIHLWTINDVRPGDIIVESSRYITIYQSPTPNSETTFRSFCFVDLDSDVFVDEIGSHNIRGSFPATKKQRDHLSQKIKEAGYEWDAEKKELKKIEKKPSWSEDDERIYQSIMDDTIQENQLNDEQTNWLRYIKYRYFPQSKQEWSEEDERILVEILKIFNIEKFEGYNIDENNEDVLKFLKSIKDRVQPRQEWSEEDENRMKKVMHILSLDGRISNTELQSIYDWLKSLRPQSQWKPSEEHIHWLKWAINRMPDTEKANEAEAVLEELLEDLKKLREE